MSTFTLMENERDRAKLMVHLRELALIEKRKSQMQIFCLALATLIGFMIGLMV